MLIDVNSAQTTSDIVQKLQVLVAATEGDGSSAKWRSKLREDDASFSATKIHEPAHRQTSNKKDFYSKMTNRIRDKGLAAPKQPTSCTCQAEVLELQKAINKMNDSLGSLTQTFDQVVKKLDTVAQDAKIHRKGTQRLIAAANGEETPEDSEDEGA